MSISRVSDISGLESFRISNLEDSRNDELSIFWYTVPIFLLIASAVYYLSFTKGAFSKTDYIASQMDVFYSLNEWLSSTLPISNIWIESTSLGNGLVLIPIVAMTIFFRPRAWSTLWATIPIAAILSSLGKNLLNMPRPAGYLEASSFIVLGDRVSASTSLPSGHTLTIFAGITVVLLSLFPSIRTREHKCYVALAILVASLIGISRVAVGAHWPMDVVIGAALGWISGLLGYEWSKRKWSPELPDAKSTNANLAGGAMIIWGFALSIANYQMESSQLVYSISSMCAVAIAFHILNRYRGLES